MILSDALLQYENYLLTSGLAIRTLQEYRTVVKIFVTWLINIEKSTTLEQKHIKSFLRYLKEDKKLAAKTIAKYITCFRSLFNFLQKEFGVPNMILGVPMPKFPQKLPNYFNESEIKRILEHLEQEKTDIGVRNYLMVSLLYSTGIRASEFVAIKISDFKENLLLVKGKGSKDRIVPVPKQLILEINNFIKYIRSNFVKENSESLFGIHSRIKLAEILQRIGKELNLHLNAHKMRHSLATHLLQKGANIRLIQKLLGHSSINTTQLYLSVCSTHLRESYDKYHPRS